VALDKTVFRPRPEAPGKKSFFPRLPGIRPKKRHEGDFPAPGLAIRTDPSGQTMAKKKSRRKIFFNTRKKFLKFLICFPSLSKALNH
jgi:hypothetical protein